MAWQGIGIARRYPYVVYAITGALIGAMWWAIRSWQAGLFFFLFWTPFMWLFRWWTDLNRKRASESR